MRRQAEKPKTADVIHKIIFTLLLGHVWVNAKTRLLTDSNGGISLYACSSLINEINSMRGSARIVDSQSLSLLLDWVASTRHGRRDQAVVLLSFKAGLRAGEISGLDWSMITTSSGKLSDSIAIHGSISKNGRGRRVPLHPKLRVALSALNAELGAPRVGPVIRSQRGGHLTPGSIVNWFTALYASVGLLGCSSHSGRRTFITNAARSVAKVGGCLRDVQELAGHSALTTTERYIEGDREAQRKLVRLL